MPKITGLDKLQKNLKDASRALSDLDGELGVISFDPNDPVSIEVALQSVEQMVDERVGRYSQNPIARSVAKKMKEKYRKMILQKASESRLKGRGID